jgi:hypothetical protein
MKKKTGEQNARFLYTCSSLALVNLYGRFGTWRNGQWRPFRVRCVPLPKSKKFGVAQGAIFIAIGRSVF